MSEAKWEENIEDTQKNVENIKAQAKKEIISTFIYCVPA